MRRSAAGPREQYFDYIPAICALNNVSGGVSPREKCSSELPASFKKRKIQNPCSTSRSVVLGSWLFSMVVNIGILKWHTADVTLVSFIECVAGCVASGPTYILIVTLGSALNDFLIRGKNV